MNISNKLVFSGHETFHCKNMWLKKGYDYVERDGKFVDQACIDLGVGRNMVSSIKFWLRAFNIIDFENERATAIANFLFNENDGVDKYLENEASLWLLHYLLVVSGYSTTYSIIFNDLRKVKPEFTKENFVVHSLGIDSGLNKNTLSKDFSVFLRMYYSKDEKNLEDSFSGLLSELELIQVIKKSNATRYSIQNNKQEDIPLELILYIILENDGYGKSISFKNLYSDFNSVGSIFAFSKEKLEKKLLEISEKFKGITYFNDAGIKELQFKDEKPNSIDILRGCYE